MKKLYYNYWSGKTGPTKVQFDCQWMSQLLHCRKMVAYIHGDKLRIPESKSWPSVGNLGKKVFTSNYLETQNQFGCKMIPKSNQVTQMQSSFLWEMRFTAFCTENKLAHTPFIQTCQNNRKAIMKGSKHCSVYTHWLTWLKVKQKHTHEVTNANRLLVKAKIFASKCVIQQFLVVITFHHWKSQCANASVCAWQCYGSVKLEARWHCKT